MELYRQRDIGEIFDATGHFVKMNKTAFTRIFLYIGIPYILLTSYFQIELKGIQNEASTVSSPDQMVEMLGDLSVFLLPLIILGLIFTVSLYLPARLASRGENPNNLEAGSIYGLSLKKSIPLFLFTLVFGFLISLGFLLLIIPGFIAMAFLIFGFVAIPVEDYSPISALKRSVQLVKGNFWKVLGILILIILIVIIVSMLFSIPLYILSFMSLFAGGDVLIGLNIWNFTATVVATVGSVLSSIYVNNLLAMTYFSLVAEKGNLDFEEGTEQVEL